MPNKTLREFYYEDNFNNTFALHYGGASAKVEKVFQIFASDEPTNIHWMFKNIFAGTKSKISVLGIVTTENSNFVPTVDFSNLPL